MSILEERGLFWWSDHPLAENELAPDGSIAGLLTIDDNGRISLELDSYFPSKQGPFGVLTDHGAVLTRGIAGLLKTSNSRVLLIGVMQNGGQVRTAGISHQRFLAADCLVGDSSLHDLTAPVFDGMSIDLFGFESWFWFRSIKLSKADDRITADWQRPEPAVYALDDAELSFEFDVKGSIPYGALVDHIALKEYATASFSLKEKESLERLRDRFRLFEDLLILLVDTEYRLNWPVVKLGSSVRATWYFSRFENKVAEAPDLHECLTYFPKLRDRFGAILGTWKAKREEYGPGFYLYLGTRRGLSLYAEHRFVNLIWGLEAYHRTRFPANPDSIKAKMDRIIGQVESGSDKEWLSRRLKYAYEPSLEERLLVSFKQLPLDLEEKRLRPFVVTCAQARHEISHFGARHRGDTYADFIQDLEKKSRALSFLYHCLLLHEIGISDEMLRKWIYESHPGFRAKYSWVDVGLLDKAVLTADVPNTRPAST
jgi:hypothetical protein